MRVPWSAQARSSHHRPYRRFGLGIVVATAIVAASWIVVVRAEVTGAELRVFRAVNGAPDALWPALWPPMQAGTVVAPVLVGVTAAWVLRRWRPTAAALVAGYAGWAAAQAVKELVVRDRPVALLTDVVLREGAQGLGFVSGHAAIAAALATVVWPYLSRRGRWSAGGLVALVGVGRIYAGAHLPLDVVGGVAIGVLVGIGTNALVGLPLHRDPHGRDRATPTAGDR